jgi:hypothetical protein
MNMLSNELAMPMLGMLALTMLVWIYLFIQRVAYATGHKIDIEEFKTPGDVASLIPGPNSSASNNFKNLLEMPVIFYTICLYLTVFGLVDDFHVSCAWVFVVFRVLHSLIHCTFNRVVLRFLAYIVSSVAVWIMVARAVLAATSRGTTSDPGSSALQTAVPSALPAARKCANESDSDYRPAGIPASCENRLP